MRKMGLAALVAGVACCVSAHAATLYDSGEGSPHGGLIFDQDEKVAAELVFGSAVTITDINLWMSTSWVVGTDSFTIGVRSVAPDGTPDALLQSVEVAGPPVTPSHHWAGASGLAWALDPGAYWFTFEVNGPNYRGVIGGDVANPLNNYALSTSTMPWTIIGGQFGIQVFGDGGEPVSFGDRLPLTWSGAPEPETWALLLTGFAAAGVALRRRQLTLNVTS